MGPGRESLPVDAGGEPSELFRRERPGDVPAPEPVEGSLVETAGAEPDAMAVPHQELHAGAFFAGKEEGLAVAGRMTRRHSGKSGQCGDTGAHVSRLADEPEIQRVQHRLSSRMIAAIAVGVVVTLAR